MKLSVIVPVYNENETILKVVNSLLKVNDVYEILVVDDASTDGTNKKIKSVTSGKVRVITHQVNLGKGKAVRTGLEAVKGDYVLIQDADLEYDPMEIPLMIEPIKRGRAEVVYGSRFFGAHTNMFYWHLVGNKFLNWVVNILFNSILSDMETGYKVMPVSIMRDLKLKSNDFSIEPEITCKLLKRQIKILEVPITYVGRTYAEGKKITWKDAYGAIVTILSVRFKD